MNIEYEGAVQPKAPLPDGWVAFSDEDGAEYYFHPETGETVWEHPGTGEHSLAAVADLRDPDTPTPTTEGSPPPQVQQQPQTEQAPSENSKDTASFFGRLLGRRKSSSEEIPPPPAAAAPAATGATKDAPELYLEGEALAAAVEALRKDAKARGEASAAVSAEIKRRAQRVSEFEKQLAVEAEAQAVLQAAEASAALEVARLEANVFPADELSEGAATALVNEEERVRLLAEAKVSEEKQARRDARRYRVASAALSAAQAYAKALAEERRNVEVAICHVASAPDEKEEEEAKEGGEARDVASTAPSDSTTGLRPLVAKLQGALKGSEDKDSEHSAQLLHVAQEPWALDSLSKLVVVEEVLEWEAWSTLFLWSGRSTYLPSQLASLVLEQESTSSSEQPPPSRDPASSIFTNASATCLLSATVMERSSPLEPHLNDKKSSGTSQVAAPSLSLEGDPLPLPAIPALLSGVTWRWVSEWQCSSPRLPGGPLHGGFTIQGDNDNKGEGSNSGDDGSKSSSSLALYLNNTGAAKEEETCCDALGWEHGRVLADLIGAPSNDSDHRHLIGGSFPTSGTDAASPDRRIRVRRWRRMRVASHVAGLLTGASQALTSSALAVAAHDLQAYTVKKHMEGLGLLEKKGHDSSDSQDQETENGSASSSRIDRESEMTEASRALANATAQLQAAEERLALAESARLRAEEASQFEEAEQQQAKSQRLRRQSLAAADDALAAVLVAAQGMSPEDSAAMFDSIESEEAAGASSSIAVTTGEGGTESDSSLDPSPTPAEKAEEEDKSGLSDTLQSIEVQGTAVVSTDEYDDL